MRSTNAGILIRDGTTPPRAKEEGDIGPEPALGPPARHREVDRDKDRGGSGDGKEERRRAESPRDEHGAGEQRRDHLPTENAGHRAQYDGGHLSDHLVQFHGGVSDPAEEPAGEQPEERVHPSPPKVQGARTVPVVPATFRALAHLPRGQWGPTTGRSRSVSRRTTP